MKQIKPIVVLIISLVFVTLLIPTVLVLPFNDSKASSNILEEIEPVNTSSDESSIEVAVYRSAKKEIEQVSLESYVTGVVASEMPAEFELEALKAQTLAARTYIVKQMMSDEKIGLPKGAIVTDTELHQVFKNDRELKKLWGKDYDWKIKKIKEAVKATEGQILTYNGEPITAQFFSTSNGYTENSEAYWSNPFPYLKSVESPWDTKSPKFYDKKVFSVKDFEKLLGVKLGADDQIGKILDRTPGKRVGNVNINGNVLSGREVREKLDLKSADFIWKRKNDQIIIETKGYGHGVGMSQYGANGMALEGKKYEDIVKYYYQGVEVSKSEPLLTNFTAKNR
ncbi:stage II sporulation protein D [Bacillus aquiflavi]|uniref:Stage II sporulation protein D n=1 Tax=Bacillus aquiflavi TaxID=2672567 RepID=A0A6B3VXK6_9BACI|nr:stage II sporulation protein D [Bacillus aquiflavi]MBA4536659.1 stage II sporulation protein D [Bacillus aquiflavi]NEY81027.1 stage II sporulation protein D [Bacillus aquiflavi]UAC47902.1 stage II sporulation protein D [Bacillus aquiflavi]